MEIRSVIFTGSQGAGKGTQANKLHEHLLKQTDEEHLLHFEAGNEFREFTKQNGHTQQKVSESLDRGEMQPVFLPAYFWSQSFINALDPDTHLIIDGSPRQLLEAKVMDTAMAFYEREPTVINLEVSEETAMKRLKKRGREDDTEESIAKRLEWYKEKVVPSVSFMREKSRYQVVDIDADRGIDAIFTDIIDALNLDEGQ